MVRLWRESSVKHIDKVLKAFVHSFLEPNDNFGVLFMLRVHVVLQHLEEIVGLTGRPLLWVPPTTPPP